jgi:hypothetical protein
MRHVALLIGVIGLFAFPASLASASGMPTRAPVPDSANTATVAAGLACDFTLHVEPVVNNEYTLTFPAEPNGDVRVIASGHLLTRFTNLDTGHSIVVNTSSEDTIVLHSDGSATVDASGPQTLVLFASDTGGPSAYVNSGRVVLNISPTGDITIVSQTGTQFDICSALS